MITRYAARRDAGRRYGYPAARVMLAAIFVVTGWDKLVAPRDAAADIAEVGLPAPFPPAVVAGVVQLLLGNPLAAPGDSGALIRFLNDLAIMGGLLMVVVWERRRDADRRSLPRGL